MEFGVFDHLDQSGPLLARQYLDRLRLTEQYDRGGIYAYHLAEHHSTPLGQAPSPSVFLAAVSQRTQRLRFGPLVYLLPFYQPLRLIEEICMLDHLSNGRFQIGVGRGTSAEEATFYGLEPARQQSRYDEALRMILAGLQNEVLDFSGSYYQAVNVPMTLRPLQRPHPPLWYGVGRPESIAWAARHGVNIVTLANAEQARLVADRFRAEWTAAKPGPETTMPFVGIVRHVVVADTAEQALDLARPAYVAWRRNLLHLKSRFRPNTPLSPVASNYPESFDDLQRAGHGIAGSPDMVRDYVRRQIALCGINYFLSWLAFGDLPVDAALRSTQLFTDEVMPAFRTGAEFTQGDRNPMHQPM